MTALAYPETGTSQGIAISTGYQPHRDDTMPANNTRDLALIRRIKAGDFDTRQQLVTSNLLHVLRSNKSYAKNGTGIFDLLRAGERGLVHALENFEREGQGHFSVYAASCIRLHIEHMLNPPRPAPGIRPQST